MTAMTERLEQRYLLAQLPAFPGAEGYGMFTTGGRGGSVYEVTNLNDSGPGSLRDAVSQPNRTIVFRVSGNIELQSTLLINQPNLTIAGQTAPGGGITIKNFAIRINAKNIIMRYLRVRPGDLGNDAQVDGISMGPAGGSDLIFDHISTSWGIDENFSIYGLPRVTIQWSIVSEALHNSKHPSGPHSMGGIQNGWDTSLHHNLYISNNDRNPKFNIADWWPGQNTDFRNNVVYNWGARATWGGNGGATLTNVVNNYYKAGPNSSNPSRFLSLESGAPGEWYVNGNYVHGFFGVTSNNWTGVANASGGGGALNAIAANQPFSHAPVTTHSALDAYELVLQHAGANVPLRDSVDTRLINDVINGTGAIINSQSAVSGWPTLPSTTPPLDSDHDGMPDSWESANSLNPNNSADRNGISPSGYTNLEAYLNSLVPTLGSLSSVLPPSQTFWPYPANGSTQQDAAVQLRWKAGFRTESERVYFGTSPSLTEADFKLEIPYAQSVVNKQLITTSSHTPGSLQNGTTYYWRIDSVNSDGVTTGQTWSFTPGLPVAGPGAGNRMEAENMTLSRAFVNGTFTEVPSEVGTIRYTFNKPSGTYRIDARYIDEGDGAGLFEIYRNSHLIGSWIANVNNDQFITRSFNAVHINTGDVIKVVSRRHQDELGRVDYVETIPVADSASPLVDAAEFQYESGQAIAIAFNEPVQVAGIDLSKLQVQSLSGGAAIAPSSVTYDAASRTATFTFAAPLADANYRATLLAGAAHDLAGNASAAALPFDFFIMTADANHDRHVDTADFNPLAANFNRTSGVTFSSGDFNYDGRVNVMDFNLLATRFGMYLAPVSMSGASTQSLPPLRQGLSPDLFGDDPIEDAAAEVL